jgi:hypothetical protein
MGNLTFQEISDPLTHRIWVINSWDIIHSKAFTVNKGSQKSPGTFRVFGAYDKETKILNHCRASLLLLAEAGKVFFASSSV